MGKYPVSYVRSGLSNPPLAGMAHDLLWWDAQPVDACFLSYLLSHPDLDPFLVVGS